jgi:Tfp pilus assembly protein PilN
MKPVSRGAPPPPSVPSLSVVRVPFYLINLNPHLDVKPARHVMREMAGRMRDAFPKNPHMLAAVAASLTLWAGVGVAGVAAHRESEAAEAAIIPAREDSTMLAGQQALIVRYGARRDSAFRAALRLRRLDHGRFLTPRLMSEVAKSLPSNTWLTQLRETGGWVADSAMVSMSLEAIAGSPEEITTFMTELGRSPFIANVNLGEAKAELQANRPVTRFTLSFDYNEPSVALLQHGSIPGSSSLPAEDSPGARP